MPKLLSALKLSPRFRVSKCNRKLVALAITLSLVGDTVVAATYQINLGLVADFESLRPLTDMCGDLGSLESLRSQLERASDLEKFRPLLERRGIVEFRMCPDGISVPGVKRPQGIVNDRKGTN
jgi:hypothetical protein